MFQIYDCQGRAVGRPQGYAKHSTAHGLVTRPGNIRRAIWDAYNKKDWGQYQIKHAWSIRLIEGIHAEIQTIKVTS